MEEDTSEEENELLKLSVDGSSCVSGSGAGLMLTSPDGWTIEYALRFGFKATNNEAEWEALIARLTIAKHLEVKKIEFTSDSQLVVGLVSGEYEAREDSMAKYLAHIQSLKSAFQVLRVFKVPKAENALADQLSKLATPEELLTRPDPAPLESVAPATRPSLPSETHLAGSAEQRFRKYIYKQKISSEHKENRKVS
ncbi:RVT_3 domain-containing protein [Cephalotus follicularis]|uniref:RVT_3 domain-containing protein n=1 Tax=Cephalotus follicularis TaxID=3775 RepID=A0A1Q3BPZ3_CEPFO|nr:RVT_3 domain-containing protein [Cephalotus follicularis]